MSSVTIAEDLEDVFRNITLGKSLSRFSPLILGSSSNKGVTALHIASKSDLGYLALPALTHVDRNIRTPDNQWTALHYAFYYGNMVQAAALMPANFKGTLRDSEGIYPVDMLRVRFEQEQRHVLKLRQGKTEGMDMEHRILAMGSDSNFQLGFTTSKGLQLVPKVMFAFSPDGLALGEFSGAAWGNGEAWIWGCAGKGRLGLGKGQQAINPTRMGISGVTKMSLGKDHGLALDDQGRVWAWGSGYKHTPRLIHGFEDCITDISASTSRSFFLAEGKLMYIGPSLSDSSRVHSSPHAVYRFQHNPVNKIDCARGGDEFVVLCKRGGVFEFKAGKLGRVVGFPAQEFIVEVASCIDYSCAISATGNAYRWEFGEKPKIIKQLKRYFVVGISCASTHIAFVTSRGDFFSVRVKKGVLKAVKYHAKQTSKAVCAHGCTVFIQDVYTVDSLRSSGTGNVPSLLSLCEDRISSFIGAKKVVQLFKYALLFNSKRLKDWAGEFIGRNFAILVEDIFANFDQEELLEFQPYFREYQCYKFERVSEPSFSQPYQHFDFEQECEYEVSRTPKKPKAVAPPEEGVVDEEEMNFEDLIFPDDSPVKPKESADSFPELSSRIPKPDRPAWVTPKKHKQTKKPPSSLLDIQRSESASVPIPVVMTTPTKRNKMARLEDYLKCTPETSRTWVTLPSSPQPMSLAAIQAEETKNAYKSPKKSQWKPVAHKLPIPGVLKSTPISLLDIQKEEEILGENQPPKNLYSSPKKNRRRKSRALFD